MIALLQGDFREVLSAFPDESFDCILADPPYGQTSLAWDRWPKGWPAEVRRLLRRSGSMWVFGNARLFMERSAEFQDWRFAQDIVWEKHNGSSFHADRFRRVHEQAVMFYRSDAPWSEVYKQPQYTFDARAKVVRRKTRPTHMGRIEEGSYVSLDGGPRLARSVLKVRSEHGRAVHPTQKPAGIIEPLLRFSCPPGGFVLDPFGGSGTTGVVAEQAGMHAVLVEADPGYVAKAADRIRGARPLPLEFF